MLSAKYRLSRAEIPPIMRRGLVIRGEGLTLRVANLDNTLKPIKLAIVVSAKTVKTATGRNLVKRRLRQAIIQLVKNLKPGYGVVVITLPAIVSQTFVAIRSNLQALFKQAKLLS